MKLLHAMLCVECDEVFSYEDKPRMETTQCSCCGSKVYISIQRVLGYSKTPLSVNPITTLGKSAWSSAIRFESNW